MRGVAGGQKISRVVHDLHAHGNVADADAVVDQGFIFARGVPGVYIVSADFEFERSGDAIVGLKLVIARCLAVFVKIDEAGGDDQAFGVERSFGFQRSGGQRADFAGGDAHVSYFVEAGFGIHDVAVGDDDLVGGVIGARRRGGAGFEGERCDQGCCDRDH